MLPRSGDQTANPERTLEIERPQECWRGQRAVAGSLTATNSRRSRP